jgi:magnesium chelatase family protein
VPRTLGISVGLVATTVILTFDKKATRLCRCGYLDDPAQACARVPRCAAEYQAKISGPLFDRIDLHVDVPAVSAADLTLPPARETSADVAARVAKVRAVQKERYESLVTVDADGGASGGGGNGANGPTIRTNAEADGELLERVAAPDAAGRELLTQAIDRLRLSARGYHRVLRVARTLADLEGADNVARVHVAEALSYRRIAPGR